MNNFRKGGFRQGGGNFGGRPKFGNKFGGGRDRGDRSERRREFFPAVCFECKKNCEIPFRPTGDKPVYCSDCFEKQGHSSGGNFNPSAQAGRGDRQTGDFQRDSHREREYQPENTRTQNDGGIDALKRQLSTLESKVNRILEIVSQKPNNSVPATSVVGEVPKVIKAIKVKAPVRKTAGKNKK